ncbi:TPA: hypothetical protein DCX15_01505 [bacterium]|nr:hypothetical protein [bacterium]
MKEPKNSLYPEDWKKKARRDWERVKRNLRDQDAEAAGYFLQQALEKYLKAYLLQHGWRLKKIHTLHTLLEDAIGYDKVLESFYDLCERVSGYYFTERYPSLIEEELTTEDIEKDLIEAEDLIEVLHGEDK